MAIYVDSSAIVKLAVRELESAALRRYLQRSAPCDPRPIAAEVRPEIENGRPGRPRWRVQTRRQR